MTTKRIAFVLGLTCLSVLLFASTAFALAGAGSNYTGADNTMDPYALNTAGTPHMGYATTTVKCAVCHAVHRGPVAGEVLLRGTVANACEFCHIQANVSTIKVYDSTATNYTTDTVFNHSSEGAAGVECVDCHAVHGAGAIATTAAGDVNEKILKGNAGTVPGGNGSVPATWNFATGSVRDGVMTKYCTQCHNYWTDAYDDAAGDTNHIMTVAGDDLLYGNARTALGVAGTTAVAYAPSTYCRSCHDAGLTDHVTGAAANNFPHYTTGARFLLSAASSADPFGAAGDPSVDGACLKCHRNGTTGTGIGY
ncbi:MAG: hypothetical protein WBJ62_00115 [Coriobacteriia bacterium]